MSGTLVLNATYEPLSVVSVKRAIVLVLSGRAVIEHAEANRVIHSSTVDVPLPLVIRLLRFVRVPWRARAAWTRRGVLTRDRHRCAYCGGPADTIDHLLPRSRGGADTWLNTVAACHADNQRKGNRTPEEAGMRLLAPPYEPSPGAVMVLSARSATATWPSWLLDAVAA